MQRTLKLGMIGLDTSHVSAFASILNDPVHPYHVAGGKIEVAFPGIPSADFELSIGRVHKYTDELSHKYGVSILDSAEAVAEQSDAVLLISVDGRVHLDIFRKIAHYGKPVFIDKPFTVNSEHAEEIFKIAAKYGVSLMSCSSLRYAEELNKELLKADDVILGADCYGPMMFESVLPAFFWYGIHSVEMLYRILGRGCVSVAVTSSEHYDCIVGTWRDGRIGVVRGNRKGNYQFGALIHRANSVSFVDASSHDKPTYAGLLERIMHMFRTGQSDIEAAETLEIIRFLECANESRQSGEIVYLSSGK
ncbi:Gfo/Idh/MocA family protein [Paenibacillus sp. GCM10027628]|uniref:Gfo/Idh/MocA family protein n=1 Tax=Paenibacillus sp. GCM10027628 TaxID=3273413 RepID=UPI00363AAC43